MRKLQIDGVFECDVQTFWENLYFLEDYGRAVYVDGMGFTDWKLESLEDDGETLTRRVLLQKPVPPEVPRALRKLVGDSTLLTEEGVFDRRTGIYSFTLTTDRLKNKGTVHGSVRAEPHPHGCLRRVELSAEVKLLGMGSLVEGSLLEALASGYRDGVQHANAFLRTRTSPHARTQPINAPT